MNQECPTGGLTWPHSPIAILGHLVRIVTVPVPRYDTISIPILYSYPCTLWLAILFR
jgi:hypothetical protein